MRYLKPLVPVALMIVIAGAARAETVAASIDHAREAARAPGHAPDPHALAQAGP